MTDALAEEQQMEIEALESIYMDDLKGRFLHESHSRLFLSLSRQHTPYTTILQWLPMKMLVQRDGTVHRVCQRRRT